MLARREPVTVRSVVAGTGVSTMAIYSHFDGMSGLWGAVRQEGFRELALRLDEVPRGRGDAVRELAALGVAYTEHAVSAPDLYRVMFDASFDLPDPAVADASFVPLVVAADRAKATGRFSVGCDPADVAMRYWASGHGVASLAVTGVLPVEDLQRHAQAIAGAVFVAAGDEPDRAARSVRAAWRGVHLAR